VEIAFDRLIKLQHLDREISATNSLLEAIPAKIEAIDQAIKQTAEIVAQAKDKLAANQKKRRELESEVKALKEQVAKFRRQLNDVKTNKEYSALLKEIDDTGRKVDGIEEVILQEMISADDIERDIKSAQNRQVGEEGRLQGERKTIQAEQKELEARRDVLLKEREVILPTIPPDQAKLYLRILKKMNGVAMSPVTDDFCSICQMRVRPQMLNELLTMKEIITCEACGRILYWVKPPEEEDDAEGEDEAGAAAKAAPRHEAKKTGVPPPAGDPMLPE
jgi:predicted  nucleic acid-binding Zn-ribbon protein